ncbi:MAG TPA: hypothetical protein VGH98_09030 [Gemmatimonadaceae bacterium]|jgi:hypothetical protein
MAADEDPSRRLRALQRTARHVIVDGALWLVFELPPLYDRRQRPSLVFESETAIRRVRDYPANWRSLRDDELFALSWNI